MLSIHVALQPVHLKEHYSKGYLARLCDWELSNAAFPHQFWKTVGENNLKKHPNVSLNIRECTAIRPRGEFCTLKLTIPPVVLKQFYALGLKRTKSGITLSLDSKGKLCFRPFWKNWGSGDWSDVWQLWGEGAEFCVLRLEVGRRAELYLNFFLSKFVSKQSQPR